MKTVCIYHANCADGLCAAFLISQVFPHAEFRPMNYGEPFPFNEYGKDDSVIIVDFSFPRKEMESIEENCGKVICFDHHKTAQADCEGLDWCIFDLDECGSSLVWRNFHLGKPYPNLVKYIKDRDLWLWKEPNSRAVSSFISSWAPTFETMEMLFYTLQTDLHSCIMEGEAIERYKFQQITAAIKNAVVKRLYTYDVPMVNATNLQSEIGHELCKRFSHLPFSVSWFQRGDGKFVYSLRSIGDFDVSSVARIYGGGGHKNAAGFQTNHQV